METGYNNENNQSNKKFTSCIKIVTIKKLLLSCIKNLLVNIKIPNMFKFFATLSV